MDDNVLRVGIGGPVGSGKTALIEALVPILIERGHRPSVITNDIYTQRTPSTSAAPWPESSNRSGSSASRRAPARTPPYATTPR